MEAEPNLGTLRTPNVGVEHSDAPPDPAAHAPSHRDDRTARPQRSRGFFLGMLLGALLVPVLGNWLTAVYLQALAHAGYWYEDKVAKAVLLEARSQRPDVVFLGASTTQNHIVTPVLAASGIDAFNYGIAGLNSTGEYPYMVREASRAAKSTVVLTLVGRSLADPPSCPPRPTLYDLVTSGYGARCLRQMKASDYKWQLSWVRLMRATASPLDAGVDPATVSALGKSFSIDPFRGVPAVNYVRGDNNRGVVVFQNGDGLVLRRLKPWEKVEYNATPVDPRRWNPEHLAYLARLIGMIRDAGKRPVLLLAGANKVEQHGTAAALAARLDVDVIDAANWHFPRSDWADKDHLNPDGAKAYSTRLAMALRALPATGKGRGPAPTAHAPSVAND